jgi:hypothetical protein
MIQNILCSYRFIKLQFKFDIRIVVLINQVSWLRLSKACVLLLSLHECVQVVLVAKKNWPNEREKLFIFLNIAALMDASGRWHAVLRFLLEL